MISNRMIAVSIFGHFMSNSTYMSMTSIITLLHFFGNIWCWNLSFHPTEPKWCSLESGDKARSDDKFTFDGWPLFWPWPWPFWPSIDLKLNWWIFVLENSSGACWNQEMKPFQMTRSLLMVDLHFDLDFDLSDQEFDLKLSWWVFVLDNSSCACWNQEMKPFQMTSSLLMVDLHFDLYFIFWANMKSYIKCL